MRRIVCIGGGPAGLYSAILLKQAMPRTAIEVHERNRPDDTFGWGVVFSDRTMEGFRAADAPSPAAIVDSFYHWDDSAFRDADLIIAADGVNSGVRRRHQQEFKPNIDVRKCRYIWLGTRQKFPAFTFAFENTGHGWFQLHAYQFSSDLSTVIVEAREETWQAHGLAAASADESI